jgi:hypothetical protein
MLQDSTTAFDQWLRTHLLKQQDRHGYTLKTFAKWMKPGAKVYAIEIDGTHVSDGSDKIAVSRCRLVRELNENELVGHAIFLAGDHEVKSGAAWAFGSSTVKAFDSATVRAFDSATVRAFDSATVKAFDSATVRAFDSATVQMWYGSPSVKLEHYAVLIDRRDGKPVSTTA